MAPRLRRGDCALVIIDVQEKYLPSLHGAQAIVETLSRLVQACEVLGVPIIITEQNPKGIGHTAEDIVDNTFGADVIEKATFSCFGEPAFCAKLDELGARQLVIAGVEAHVCVAQTSLDALERGYDVFTCSDGIGARTAERRDAGLLRLRQAGAVQDCAEGIIFSLMERSDNDEFKMIHRIVK